MDLLFYVVTFDCFQELNGLAFLIIVVCTLCYIPSSCVQNVSTMTEEDQMALALQMSMVVMDDDQQAMDTEEQVRRAQWY